MDERHRRTGVAVVALAVVALLFSSGREVRAAEPAKPARRIAITVTEKGFEPARIEVKKGEPVILVFTRKTEKTCAKEVIVYSSVKDKVERKLPLDTPVEIAATFPKTGELGYSCAMSMVAGVIAVN